MLTQALLFLAIGAVAFEGAPLPGVTVGNVTPFTGRATVNFLHGDVDGDGAADLLLPETVYLQERGVYNTGTSAAMPQPSTDTDADFWAGRLYCRSGAQLRIHAFDGSAWHETMRQTLPDLETGPESPVSSHDRVRLRFRRFLHDLDGDGSPELIAVDRQGAHIFRMNNGRFTSAAVVELPETVVDNRSTPQPIWPADARKIVFPEQRMTCRLVFDSPRIRTISLVERRRETVRFAIETRTLARDDTSARFRVAGIDSATPASLPAHMRPCRLNGDDTVDFAGGRWLPSTIAPIPTQIYEVSVTLDGGDTVAVRRASASMAFRPHCSFVDFDGDGDMDLVLESTEWPRGSIREHLARLLGKSELRHRIRIYEQHEKKFSSQPAVQFAVDIKLEAPPAKSSGMRDRYEAGGVMNVTGDFNNDGFRDLCVRTGPETLDVYLADGGAGFQRNAAVSLTLDPNENSHVTDLNADGRSDLFVQSPASGPPRGTAYYAREMDP